MLNLSACRPNTSRGASHTKMRITVISVTSDTPSRKLDCANTEHPLREFRKNAVPLELETAAASNAKLDSS